MLAPLDPAPTEGVRPTMTERVCFLLQIRPDMLDEYLAAHESVWPEMLAALSRSGWRNYSLFLRQSDGLVVGYLETDDYAAAQRAMDAEAINLQMASCDGFVLPVAGRCPPG